MGDGGWPDGGGPHRAARVRPRPGCRHGAKPSDSRRRRYVPASSRTIPSTWCVCGNMSTGWTAATR